MTCSSSSARYTRTPNGKSAVQLHARAMRKPGFQIVRKSVLGGSTLYDVEVRVVERGVHRVVGSGDLEEHARELAPVRRQRHEHVLAAGDVLALRGRFGVEEEVRDRADLHERSLVDADLPGHRHGVREG